MTEAATSTWSPPTWAARGPWRGILGARRIGADGPPGVIVRARDGLGIASLITDERGRAALAAMIEARFGLALPSTPRAESSDERGILWAGRAQWLLIARSRLGFPEQLRALEECAAVADQSDGRAVLRLRGPKVRDALAKGCMIDLHPSAFAPGAVALTAIAHIGVQLWRVDEDCFEIIVARSSAGSFWSWLSSSAAEYGCEVVSTD